MLSAIARCASAFFSQQQVPRNAKNSRTASLSLKAAQRKDTALGFEQRMAQLFELRKVNKELAQMKRKLSDLETQLQDACTLRLPAQNELIAFETYDFSNPAGSKYKIALDRGSCDLVSATIRQGGTWLSSEQKLILSNLTPAMKVLDIGACVGSFALPCALAGAQVIAVEASPRSSALLSLSACLNGFPNLRVVSAAVWSESTTLFLNDRGSNSTVSPQPQQAGPPIAVKAMSLPEIISSSEIEAFDIIKLDIEGSEIHAVNQMSGMFSPDSNPLLLFESNGHCLYRQGHTVNGLLRAVEKLGLMIFRLDQDELITVDSSCIQLENCVDYIAARRLPAYLAALPLRSYPNPEELAYLSYNWSFHHDVEHRMHLARTLVSEPCAELLKYEIAQSALARLQNDPEPAVREAC